MRKILFSLAFASVLGCPFAYANNVGVSVGINIGNQPPAAVPVAVPVAVPAPPPVQPVYVQPPVVIEEPPEFIAPPQLGFYAAVGVPYDLFYVGTRYYLSRGNVWYAAPNYNGPWVTVSYRTLPPGLRKYPYAKIRYYRDSGYRDYRRGGSPYWEKHHFHPEKHWKEQRKEEHKAMKEERKWAKEQRKEDKKWEKEMRKHEKHEGKWDR